jgi:PIN domain nuclease of toxin-antitoxin system
LRVLLDTQIIVQAYLGEELPKKIQALLADPETERLMSAASVIECALKDRLGMKQEHIEQAAQDLRLTIIPFTPQHGYRLFTLPLHHKDPFDRMIIATALTDNIPIVGGDRIFKKYAGLKVLWR